MLLLQITVLHISQQVNRIESRRPFLSVNHLVPYNFPICDEASVGLWKKFSTPLFSQEVYSEWCVTLFVDTPLSGSPVVMGQQSNHDCVWNGHVYSKFQEIRKLVDLPVAKTTILDGGLGDDHPIDGTDALAVALANAYLATSVLDSQSSSSVVRYRQQQAASQSMKLLQKLTNGGYHDATELQKGIALLAMAELCADSSQKRRILSEVRKEAIGMHSYLGLSADIKVIQRTSQNDLRTNQISEALIRYRKLADWRNYWLLTHLNGSE